MGEQRPSSPPHRLMRSAIGLRDLPGPPSRAPMIGRHVGKVASLTPRPSLLWATQRFRLRVASRRPPSGLLPARPAVASCPAPLERRPLTRRPWISVRASAAAWPGPSVFGSGRSRAPETSRPCWRSASRRCVRRHPRGSAPWLERGEWGKSFRSRLRSLVSTRSAVKPGEGLNGLR